MASSTTSSFLLIVIVVIALVAHDSRAWPQPESDTDTDTADDNDDYHLLERRQANGTNGTTVAPSLNGTTQAPGNNQTTVAGNGTTPSPTTATLLANGTDNSTATNANTTSTTTPAPSASIAPSNGTSGDGGIIHTGSIFSDPNNPVVLPQFQLTDRNDGVGTTLPPSIIIPISYQVPPIVPGEPYPPYSAYFVPQVGNNFQPQSLPYYQQPPPPNFLPNPPFPPPILPPPPEPYIFPALPYGRENPGQYFPRPLGVPMEGYRPPLKR